MRNMNDWIKIEFEDGTDLIVTKKHRIWLPELQCYRNAEDLQKELCVLKTE